MTTWSTRTYEPSCEEGTSRMRLGTVSVTGREASDVVRVTRHSSDVV